MRWRRFVDASGPAEIEPPPTLCGCAAVRLPAAAEALELCLAQLSAILHPGSPLWIFGTVDEGVLNALSALSKSKRLSNLFSNLCVKAQHQRDGALPAVAVLECRRTETETGSARLDLWATDVPVKWSVLGLADEGYPPELRINSSWRTYPGLFAGGVVDQMTAALLRTLPLELPSGGRVLDYACGSGMIGGYLQRKDPSLKLHLLDVDAAAIEAARVNVEVARHYLADGWPVGRCSATFIHHSEL